MKRIKILIVTTLFILSAGLTQLHAQTTTQEEYDYVTPVINPMQPLPDW